MSQRFNPRAAGGGTPTKPTTVNQTPPSKANITTVPVPLASTTLLLANPNRRGAIFWNDHGSATVYLALGTLLASNLVFSVKLGPGAFYELKFPAFTGDISAASSLLIGDANVLVTELLP